MDKETRSSLNSKSFLYTIRPMHLSDEPKFLFISKRWRSKSRFFFEISTSIVNF